MTTPAELEDPAVRIVETTWALVLDDPSRDQSVRRIAAAAGVNLAMVSYYFDSKEGLLRKMFLTYAEPLMQARIRRLSLLQRPDLTLEDVLSAWLAPAFDEIAARRFMALTQMLRLHHAAFHKRVFAEAFDDGAKIFIDALRQLLPNLPREAIVCRFHATATAVAVSDDASFIENMNACGDGEPIDHDVYMAELLAFAIAGFRAPAGATSGAR